MTPKYLEKGDSLLGERIAAKAREVYGQKLVHLTGSHRGTALKLRGSAYCVIEVPLKSVLEKKK